MVKKAELTPDQLARFDKCYSVYRKKKARGQAETTWQKWNPDDQLTNEIFEAILAQNRAGEAYCETRFLRNFSTYLNDKGWKDEIPSVMEAERPKAGAKKVSRLYDEKWAKIAENYCVEHGLYIRGVTPRKEAKHNMAVHMAQKLGKRVFKKMFPKLAGDL